MEASISDSNEADADVKQMGSPVDKDDTECFLPGPKKPRQAGSAQIVDSCLTADGHNIDMIRNYPVIGKSFRRYARSASFVDSMSILYGDRCSALYTM